MAIKQLIKQFSKDQKTALGYERYRVRTNKKSDKTLEHWVDVYTKSGLLIKTKLCFIPDAELEIFILDTTEQYLSLPKED